MNVLGVLRRFATPTETVDALDETIAALEPFKEDLVAGLIEALHVEERDVQLLALQVIHEMQVMHDLGPDTVATAEVVREMLATLNSGDRLVRIAAATILGDIGGAARSALPKLEWLLQCEDEVEQFSVANSILEIDPCNSKALSLVLGHLRNEESSYRSCAARNLGNLGCVGAILDLKMLIEDHDAMVRSEASLALWKITKDPEIARSVGRKMITDSDGMVRQIGREHLQELNEDLSQENPPLVTELILRAEAIGKPPAVRYLIFSVIDKTWWDGQSFQQDSDRAVRYATSNAVCADTQFILKQHYGDLPRRRYVVPMEIEVYGDVSESKIARYLHQSSVLTIRAEEYGNGPGESLVLPVIRWGEIRGLNIEKLDDSLDDDVS